MDKIFSTRIDEAAIDVLERLSRQLRISKKRFIEEAIRLRAQAVPEGAGNDVWAETAGAWNRAETAEATAENSRRRFRKAFGRHHEVKHARLHR